MRLTRERESRSSLQNLLNFHFIKVATILFVVGFLFSLPNFAFASISLVGQTIAQSPSNGNGTVTSAIDTTGATLLVVSVSYLQSGTMTLSDSYGNTWTALAPTNQTAASTRVKLFYTVPPSNKVGTGHTFTAGGTGVYAGIGVMAFSGTSGTPLDQSGGAMATQPGSLTPSVDNSLMITAMGAQGSVSTSYNVDSGFTKQQAVYTATSFGLGMGYLIQTTKTAENPTWSVSGVGTVEATNMAVFLAAPVGTAYTLTPPTATTLQLNMASGNFTITPNGTYTGTITPSSNGSGTFSPTSLSWSASSNPQTFTYTPTAIGSGTHTISGTASPALGTDQNTSITVVPYLRLVDSFTGTNGTLLSNHNADSTDGAGAHHTWAKFNTYGTDYIALNGSGAIAGSNTITDVSNWAPATRDYTVRTTVNIASSFSAINAGIGGRVVNSGSLNTNGYFVIVSGTGPTLNIVLYKGLTVSLGLSTVVVNTNTSYTLEMSMIGNLVTVYWNGAPVFIFTASGSNIVSNIGNPAIFMTNSSGMTLSGFSASPAVFTATAIVPASHSNPTRVSVTAGANTYWTSGTTFTISGAPSGTAVVGGSTVVDVTHQTATFNVTTGATTGTFTVVDNNNSTASTITNVSAPSITVSPSSSVSPATIVIEGTNTAWGSEVALGNYTATNLLSVSSGSLSNVTINGDGSITATLTYSGTPSITVTDNSTGSTATFTGTTATVGYRFQQADFWANNRNVLTGNPLQSDNAYVVFQTNASSVTVYGKVYGYSTLGAFAQLGVWKSVGSGNGVPFSGSLSSITLPTSNGFYSFTISGLSGASTITITSGLQTTGGVVGTPIVQMPGTYISYVSYAAGSTFTISPPQAPTVVVYGDSIAVGSYALDGSQKGPEILGWVNLLRTSYNINTANESWGYRSLYDDYISTGGISGLASQIAGYSPNTVWLAIGTNDYGLNKWGATDFGTAYASLLDALHAALPSARIICQTPLVRSTETANNFGNTLTDYRTQIQTACNARVWTTYVDGTTFLTLSDLAEGLHPSTAGHAKYAARAAPVLAQPSYTVSGPASGSVSQASTAFIVTLGDTAAFIGDQTITISDGGNGGTFTPSVGGASTNSVTVTPTANATSFTFTYTPASIGSKTLSFTNGQVWTNPSPITFQSNTPVSTPTVTITSGQATTSITQTSVTLNATTISDGNASTTDRGFFYGTSISYGSVASTTSTQGIGAFSQNLTGLTCNTTYHFIAFAINSAGTGTSTPDQTFTTNSCVASAYTFAGPPSGNVGSASTNFTVTPNGPYNGTITLTPTAGFGLSATTLTWSGDSSGKTFTITPNVAGSITLTPSNNGSLTDALPLTYSSNATVPDQPTAVSAATSTPNQATVTFTAPIFTGGSTILYYLASSTPGNFMGVSMGASSGSIVVSGLTNGTSYTFAVYAVNAVGTSTPSTASNAVTPIGLPGAPTGVTATAGNTQASVTFSAPGVTGGSQITGYTVTSNPSGGIDMNAGQTALTHTVTGLVNGTPYTFTVTATNIVGNGSASSASSPVTPSTVAAVSTNSTTNIASTTSTLNGSIISTGGSDASQRGFAYGTVADLSTVTATTTLGSQIGTGNFTSNVTSLTSNTTYYVRAYSVNASGTTTGSILSFLTLPAVPTMTTSAPTAGSGIFFTANGNITATGGVNATVRGFVYGTTLAYGSTTTESNSFSTGVYTASITGLACNTLYHVNSYATNTGGTGYGSDQTITTGVCTKPIVATSTPSGITTTAATLNGSITADGNASSTVEGFNWGNDTSYGHVASTNGTFGIGSFSQPLTGLVCGTTYHYQVFATNVAGQGTSTDQTFSTSACQVTATPTVTTSISSSGGGSASSQVNNLIAMGNYTLAQQIAKQYGLTIPTQNIPVNVPTSNSGSSFTRTLKAGVTNSDVKKLQIFLNAQGFMVAQKGAGSSGHETNYFGPATKAALMKFQLAHKKETLDPQGLKAPTGFFGVDTMKTVNNLMK